MLLITKGLKFSKCSFAGRGRDCLDGLRESLFGGPATGFGTTPKIAPRPLKTTPGASSHPAFAKHPG